MEIQVRTALQHTWAETSEKLSDVIDPAIKYGGGPDQVKGALKNGSTAVDLFEKVEGQVAHIVAIARKSKTAIPDEVRQTLLASEEQMVQFRKVLDEALRKSVSTWVEQENGPQQ